MKKLVFWVVYSLLIVAGIATAVFIYMSTKTTCITKDKICVTYGHSWKVAKANSPYDFSITQTKPEPALFEVALSKTKISGSANALAGALNQQLGKDAPSYKLVESNAIVVNKTVAVEMVFDYLPQGAPEPVRQMYVVMPVNGQTYYLVSETTTANYSKVKPEFDKILSQVELK